MTDNSVNVTYKAKADFSALVREAAKARLEMAALNKEAERGKKISSDSAAARRDETAALKDGTAAVRARTRVQTEFAAGAKRAADAIRSQNRALRDGERAAGAASSATRKVASATEDAGKKAETFGLKFEAALKRMLGIKNTESVVTGSLNKIRAGLDKLQSARTNNNFLSGPFVILVPVLTALLSLLNPVIAGLGALSAAAIGVASSLGTLAGAAAGLVPALSAALGVALALRVALGGVGAAIKAGTSPSTTSRGTSGTKQDPYSISSVEKISRAQDAYRRSVQDVHFAEQNLFEARRQYTRQVQDLTEAVNEYTDATRAADAASVESAQQNYDNVLASSSSTKADKDAALAAIAQAKEQQQRDALQHERDVQDLAELKQGGRENNQSVVDARRGVTDATNARRDAALGVKNARYDAAHPVATNTAGGAAGADPYAAALGKLSPAAKTFVQWVVAMKSSWESLQRAVQQSFFSKFVGDLDRLKGLLPPVQSALVAIAGVLGKVADGILRQVTSPNWRSDIVTFGTLLAPIILTAGKGLQVLLQAFKDLTIAATPFFGKVVSALAKGAEDFASFIENGRKTGSIKSALDTVFTVMSKWWEVIKNISATLFNYGKAAAPFGQWLTDGIVRLTGAWKDASETATKANSPFKQWLEDVKPLLTEMGKDLGAFFGWIGQVASNKDNISAITDLLKAFRTKVAPKIADILQQLVTAKVPEAFVNFVVALTGFLDDLVANGGAKGVANFFNGLAWILNALTAAASSPVGRFITNALLPLIGTLAAFTLPLGPVSLFLKVLTALTDFSPTGALSKVGGWIGDLAGAVGRFAAPAFATAASVLGDILGFLAAPIVLPKNVLPDPGGKNAPQASGPLDTKTWTKNAALALTTWAGGVPGLISKATGDAFRATGGPKAWIDKQSKKIHDWAVDLYKKISAWAGDVFRKVQTVAAWIGAQAGKIHDWAVELWRKVAAWAGDVWRNVTGIGGWLSDQWSTFSRWASGIPAKVGKALSGLWDSLPSLSGWLNSAVKGLGAVGGAVAAALGLPGAKKPKGNGFSYGGGGSFGSDSSSSSTKGGGAAAKWAPQIRQALALAGAPQGWLADIETIINHESSGNPKAINNWDSNAKAGHPSQGLMQTIPSTFNAYAGSLAKRGITDPLANIYAGVRYIMARYKSPENLKGIQSVRNGGGWIGYASGGLVGGVGTGDIVPARLEPGEFVMPKTAVQRVGLAQLESMRAMSARPVEHRVRATAPTQNITNTYVVNQYYPKPEKSESVARTLRNVAYLHKGVTR